MTVIGALSSFCELREMSPPVSVPDFSHILETEKARNPFGKQLILPNNLLKDYSIQRAFLRSASQLASPITVGKAI